MKSPLSLINHPLFSKSHPLHVIFLQFFYTNCYKESPNITIFEICKQFSYLFQL